MSGIYFAFMLTQLVAPIGNSLSFFAFIALVDVQIFLAATVSLGGAVGADAGDAARNGVFCLSGRVPATLGSLEFMDVVVGLGHVYDAENNHHHCETNYAGMFVGEAGIEPWVWLSPAGVMIVSGRTIRRLGRSQEEEVITDGLIQGQSNQGMQKQFASIIFRIFSTITAKLQRKMIRSIKIGRKLCITSCSRNYDCAPWCSRCLLASEGMSLGNRRSRLPLSEAIESLILWALHIRPSYMRDSLEGWYWGSFRAWDLGKVLYYLIAANNRCCLYHLRNKNRKKIKKRSQVKDSKDLPPLEQILLLRCVLSTLWFHCGKTPR
ncbi:hypothetical protein VP01_5826g1 [Puccinia sorghi]|uniref:Uncharacterized protein n=1 Tax=Puccinia sorghi TaxID=27349 RepID=A0A0L6UI46_9BASI|nr:hypothetical protein VP01_5826g1 [Puccinia sorghi]